MVDPSAADLVLFTTAFPFGNAEYFLEGELPYLAARFRRVLIVPIKAPGQARPVPQGVTVETTLAVGRPTGIRLASDAAIKAAAAPAFYRELARRPGALAHWRGVWRATRYFADALRVRDWIEAYRRRPGTGRTIFYSYWLGHAALAAHMLKVAGTPVTLMTRAHGSDLYEYANVPAYLPYRRQTLAGADGVFTVSEHGRHYLVSRFPFATGQTAVARLGVCDPGFLCEPSADGVFRIASCSFMVPGKRLDRLIVGLAAFARSHPERRLEWHHLGDGPLRSKLEGAARLALPANVAWHFHGQVPNRGVLDFYRAQPVDAFVNVSESEGIPVSIMEALSVGIPAIATAVGGSPEIVWAGHGILLDPNPTAPEIAAALGDRTREGATAMRAAARRTWEAHYDARKNYNQFIEAMVGLVPAT